MSSVQQEADALDTLEERITRVVDLITTLRAEKGDLEAELRSAQAERDALRREVDELRGERKQARTRIEKLLGQLDLLSGA